MFKFRLVVRSAAILAFALPGVARERATVLQAEEPVSFERAARTLQEATVTLRVDATEAPPSGEPQRVSVFTGASVGPGLIVTALCEPALCAPAVSARVTLADGDQAVATPRVLDEFSGLGLFSVAPAPAAELKLATAAPEVGGWVVCGSGWGAERAVVSLGVVSGVERTLAGANYPPLVQCDFRTTETSCGAPVVNRSAELVGVMVAADEGGQGRGWAYCVPARHVARLLEVHAAKGKPPAASDPAPVHQDAAGPASDSEPATAPRVIVLKRARPIVGMELDGQPDAICVTRVVKDSPADKAGLRVGDHILAADGVKIRSVYQAVRPTLYKQPGDKMTYLVRQNDEVRAVEVVLGGGVDLPVAKSDDAGASRLFEPKLVVGGESVTRAQAPALTTQEANVRDATPGLEDLQSLVRAQRELIEAHERERKQAAKELQSLKLELERLRGKPPATRPNE